MIAPSLYVKITAIGKVLYTDGTALFTDTGHNFLNRQ